MRIFSRCRRPTCRSVRQGHPLQSPRSPGPSSVGRANGVVTPIAHIGSISTKNGGKQEHNNGRVIGQVRAKTGPREGRVHATGTSTRKWSIRWRGAIVPRAKTGARSPNPKYVVELGALAGEQPRRAKSPYFVHSRDMSTTPRKPRASTHTAAATKCAAVLSKMIQSSPQQAKATR